MNNKDKYGEVFTPPSFVQQMINDSHICGLSFEDIQTVFEPGAGKGVFFDTFVNENNCFSTNFKYFANEINEEHLEDLQNITSKTSNHTYIIIKDCLQLESQDLQHLASDMVIGNLPFNCNTKKFVPSLAINHKDDKNVTQSKSVTLWNKLTHFCFKHILKPGGYFYAIIPCIWLKPDRGGIYDLFTRDNTILLLRTFDCKTANTIFKYNCQTPICYVLVQKKKRNNDTFKLYDQPSKKYMDFSLLHGKCIPTHHTQQFISHSKYLKNKQVSSCYDHVLKISTLNPTCLAGEIVRFHNGGLENYNQDAEGGEDEETYKIITGSLFDKKTNRLSLNGFVSKTQCLYFGKPKLILPHKRLAKFFKDYDGSYSCYGRDIYVFLCDSKTQIDELYDFLNGNIIVNQMIESGFTIRMNFIEKYVFQYIPWIFDDRFDYDDYRNS